MTRGYTKRKDAKIHLLRDYRELVLRDFQIKKYSTVYSQQSATSSGCFYLLEFPNAGYFNF